jgi:hypothetical protein
MNKPGRAAQTRAHPYWHAVQVHVQQRDVGG